MFIDYTATREPDGSGDSHIDHGIQPPKRVPQVESDESDSMSGVSRETQLHRYQFEWAITSLPVPTADIGRWREFFGSVLARETFTIDIFGTQASPDNPITASLVKGTWNETRIGPGYYRYSFRVLER